LGKLKCISQQTAEIVILVNLEEIVAAEAGHAAVPPAANVRAV